MDVTPDGSLVLVTGITGDMVTIIDVEAMAQKKEIQVGQGPHGVRTSSDGRWAYVAVSGEDKIVVIDLSDLEIEDSIMLGEGSFPFWIAVHGNM